jgi:peptidyl-prolyl cis-trans isomerase C
MIFSRSLLFVFPAVCLLAQTPPKTAPAPKPEMSVSVENAGPAPVAVPPDRVVIAVGDEKITAAQFDQLVDTIGEQYRALARGPQRKQFADNLVKVLVLAQEAHRRKLDENPAYKTQAAFAASNVLAGTLYRELANGSKLDDAAVRKYYEEHKKEFEQVRARHILIRAASSPVPVKPGQKSLTDAEALAKALEIRKKIEGGADFAALAGTESDDTASGKNGGDLGFFRHGQMVPGFEEAAFKLKPGELSEPIKTQFGYHVIKVEAFKSFDDVRPEVERQMRPDQAQKAIDELQKNAAVTLDPEFFGTPKK